MNRETQTQDSTDDILDEIGAGIERLKAEKAELLEALEALHEASGEMVNRYGPRGNVADTTYLNLQSRTAEAGKAIQKARGE